MLIELVVCLRKYLDIVLEHRQNISHPLSAAVQNAVPILLRSRFFCCTDDEHRAELFKLVCTKFFRPLLTNFATNSTELQRRKNLFVRKPVSRKILKVCGASVR